VVLGDGWVCVKRYTMEDSTISEAGLAARGITTCRSDCNPTIRFDVTWRNLHVFSKRRCVDFTIIISNWADNCNIKNVLDVLEMRERVWSVERAVHAELDQISLRTAGCNPHTRKCTATDFIQLKRTESVRHNSSC
jgi:hypothetical protein